MTWAEYSTVLPPLDQRRDLRPLLKGVHQRRHFDGKGVRSGLFDADDNAQTDTLPVRVEKTTSEFSPGHFSHKEARSTLIAFQIETIIDDPGSRAITSFIPSAKLPGVAGGRRPAFSEMSG